MNCTMFSYIDLTKAQQSSMAEVLEAELVSGDSSGNVFAGLLIASILISALFLVIAYSPDEDTVSMAESENESSAVSYTHLTLPTKA